VVSILVNPLAHRTSLGDLDHVLGAGLASLDITLAERHLAVGRYRALGRTLDRHWETMRGDNCVSPQGSFLLGTVTRRIHRDDDIDIDCVVLKDVAKTSVTQRDLKADVGAGVRKYAASHDSSRPLVSESDRCWTLSWPGMHLDALPAVPNGGTGGTGLLITDRHLRAWLPSDPAGYATWFRDRMSHELLNERTILAKKLQVDDVPDWKVKTTLQQSVQALKRHRDLYFADNLDERPSSIIITTLAAHAYPGPGELYDVLRTVSAHMPNHLEGRPGQWRLSNPVQDQENFADYWAVDPRRADRFFEWIGVAAADFRSIGARSGLDIAVSRIQEAFGPRVALAASAAVSEATVHARRAGELRMAGATGLLSVASRAHASSSSTRMVKDHNFHGGK